MQEIFENVREEIKNHAEMAWQLATMLSTPIRAAEFLDNFISYYKNICTEEEIEFLQFYFHMKLEMMKE